MKTYEQFKTQLNEAANTEVLKYIPEMEKKLSAFFKEKIVLISEISSFDIILSKPVKVPSLLSPVVKKIIIQLGFDSLSKSNKKFIKYEGTIDLLIERNNGKSFNIPLSGKSSIFITNDNKVVITV